jgi:hypothetical protein
VAVPTYFEENRGQTDSHVRFIARPSGYRAFFTDTEAVFLLPRGKVSGGGGQEPVADRAADVVRMRIEGAPPSPPAALGAALPGVSNYFIGEIPSRWVTAVPHYGEIRSHDSLWSVETRWRGLPAGKLEYDVVLAPRVDPRAIGLRFDGARSLDLTKAGDLLVGAQAGVMRHTRPEAWQIVDGERRSVACDFEVLALGRVGFRLGKYDPSLSLVIDPRVEFSTYLGGGGSDTVTRVRVDGSGNVYVVGTTQSSDFPMQGAYQSTKASANGDAFITKLNPSGTALVYSTYLGGNDFDVANGLAVDSSGAVYLAGRTDSTDFPTASPIFGNNLYPDAFLTKIAPSGASLVYSTYLGGSFIDYGNDVAVDGTGAAYVVGQTLSTDFPTQSPFQATFGGTTDAFVCKVNAGGTALVYSTYLGGTSGDSGSRVRVDGSGNAVVVGTTSASNFPLQSAFQPNPSSGGDMFIAKFNATGSGLIFSSFLGGNGANTPTDLVLDGSGAAYFTGGTTSTNLATALVFQGIHGGGTLDAFVAKVPGDGSSLAFFTYLGGSGSDKGLALAVHSSGQVFVAGLTTSTNFPTLNALQGARSGSQDAFLARLSSSAGSLVYSTYYGGTGSEEADGIALDGATTSVLMVGTTDSLNFPTTTPYQGSNAGSTDAFVVRLSTTPYPPPSGLGSSLAALDAIQLDWTDNSADETGFEIQRKVGAGAFGSLVTVAANTVTYTDSALARGTKFTYRVRAVSGEGPSAWSNETTVTTPPAIPGAPLSPSGLTATLVSSVHADLTWTDESSDEDFFEVQRREGGGSWQVLATPATNATSYSDYGIFPDRTYEYRIRAGNNAGYSDYSETAGLATPASLDVGVVKGLLKDSATLSKDVFTLRGTLALNGESPDGSYDPIADGFEIRLGGRQGASVLALGPAVDGWVLKNGRATWKSPRGSVTKAKLIINGTTGEWSLVIKRLTLPPIPANPLGIALAIGDDAGTWLGDWRSVPRRVGVLKFP